MIEIPDAARLHFDALPREQQLEAVRRLAATGMSDHGISHATGWAVEMVRRAIAERAREVREVR